MTLNDASFFINENSCLCKILCYTVSILFIYPTQWATTFGARRLHNVRNLYNKMTHIVLSQSHIYEAKPLNIYV